MKKALVVGINYIGTDAVLNGCINDANRLSATLKQKYKYTDVTVLTDTTAVKPTRSVIEREIAKLVADAKPGDVLVFHYSGHGSYIADSTSDESDGKDEVIVPVDYTTTGVINDDWMFDNLCKKIPAGVVLYCFMDCCHSGTMLDLKYNIKSVGKHTTSTLPTVYNPAQWTNDFLFHMERSSAIAGKVCSFSGCEDAQTSADAKIAGIHQGAFTSCLLDFLNTVKQVKVIDVLKELNARLDIKKFKQTSQLSIGYSGQVEDTFLL